jgi:uncharacterized protein with PQ loop repeat
VITDVVAQDTLSFNKAEFQSMILNGISLTAFAVYIFYGILGMLVNIISDIIRRDKSSPNSPAGFSWSYWWSDNWRRFMFSFLCLPIGIIFCNDLLSIKITIYIAFSIGLTSDHLIELLKRKNIVKSALSASNEPSV